MFNFKKASLLLFIVAAPLVTQASSPAVTTEDTQKQIMPLHKVTSKEQINETLEKKPETDINAKTTQGLTPVDSLVARALKAKRQHNNIVEFDKHIDTAIHLIGRGGSTAHESVADYLFDQIVIDLKRKN